MTPHPPKHDREPRRTRLRHRWAFEQLEDRTLLATVPGSNLADAIPLTAPSGTHAGTIAPDAPVFFRIGPTADALLIARVHAEGTLTRLSLLDSQGHLLVQSDGQTATNLDDFIAQHVVAETDYLELQSLGGAVSYTLTTDLTESSQPNQPLPVGSPNSLFIPDALVTGDFNGDGRADLAVAGIVPSGGGEVEVLLGTGDGTSLAAAPISTGFDPSALVTGDFNGDGRADLAVAGADPSGQGVVEVLLGTGDTSRRQVHERHNTGETFRAAAPISTDFDPSAQTGDFNGDGIPDLVVAGADPSGQGVVEVLLGTGDGTFRAAAPISTGFDPSAQTGDFNGDGIPDLVVANSGGNNVSGQYDQVPRTSVADFNDDGIPDLVVAGADPSGQGVVEVFLGSGDGTLSFAVPISTGFDPSAHVTGDFNGDGRADLAVAGADPSGQGIVEVLLGRGDGTLREEAPISTGLIGGNGATDLLVANAGSNTLTLIRDINGGNVVIESLPSGGAFPVAAVEIDVSGGEVSDLLVANSDGHLALFLGGRDGLELSSIFEDPDLPNPTALAMDDLGRIFGVSEGVAAAVSIILGLGGGGVGNVSPGPPGPGEQQVAQLQPLSRASLAVVATLLSTSVEITSNEIAGPAEAENAEISLATAEPTGDATAGPGATGGAALPNQSPLQSFLPQSSPDTDPDGAADPIRDDISVPAVVTEEGQNPVARFLSGLDEAFSRARLKARQGSLFAPLSRTEATEPKLKALDALLARWSPVITTMGAPVPKMALEDGRADVAVAPAVDAALQALGSDRERPGAAKVDDRISSGGPIPVGRSALALGMASIGLAAVAWPVADLVRPSTPQRQHRFPRTGRGRCSGRPPTGGPPSGATSSSAPPPPPQ